MGLVFLCCSARGPFGAGPGCVKRWVGVCLWKSGIQSSVSGVTATEELRAGSCTFKSAGGATSNTSLRFPTGQKIKN